MDLDRAYRFYRFYRCDDISDTNDTQLFAALQTAASWRHYGPQATRTLIAEMRRRGYSWRDIERHSSFRHNHDDDLVTKISAATARRLLEATGD
jgi:hypothetical protein